MNRNVLYYLEHLDAFPVMETHIMDRVMQEYWQSNLDSSGDFMAASTCYSILSHQEDRYTYDFEHRHRFYQPSTNREAIMPHRFSFMVVRRSMQIRYFFEMIFFFVLALIFQLELLSLSTAYNQAAKN